jgi:UDP-N-acetylglucosamine transferase subunit ALG13
VIFVAIGTTGFSELVRAMDGLSTSLSEDVVMQIGHSGYVPKHCEYFRFAPSLFPYYERASLVVSHGGLGIVTEVLNYGRPLVTVEDPDQPDRHQREILSEWEREGHLVWCKDMEQLPEAIKQAMSQEFRSYEVPECRIHTIIAEFLGGMGRQG